jgi:hypothetical protein
MIYDNYDNPKLAGKSDIAAVRHHEIPSRGVSRLSYCHNAVIEVEIGHLIHVTKLGRCE